MSACPRRQLRKCRSSLMGRAASRPRCVTRWCKSVVPGPGTSPPSVRPSLHQLTEVTRPACHRGAWEEAAPEGDRLVYGAAAGALAAAS